MKNNKNKNAKTGEFFQLEPIEINDVELLEIAGGRAPQYTEQTAGACLTPTLQPSNYIC